MVDEQMGVDLLLRLPGARADRRSAEALRRLDRAMAAGDTCIALADCAAAADEPIDLWRASLLASGLVGEAAARLPVVLVDDLLSSRRYWRYEAIIAATLRRRCADRSRLTGLRDDPQVAADLARCFPRSVAARVDGVDWQRLAACVALAHGGSIITGGPGTGKTTVAGKVIAIAQRIRARQTGSDCSVFIAAPTGKAAQRLRESLIASGRELVGKRFIAAEELQRLTEQVGTLHRLLHDRRLPGADLVVIDEVSMADAATLARVLQRLPERCQLLLLGDPQQLASVDAGHVLGELARFADPHVHPDIAGWYADCGGGKEPVPRRDDLHELGAAQVHLRKNWRSQASPAVSRLARAVQESPFAVQCCLAATELAPAAGATATTGDGRQVQVAIERRDIVGATQVLAQLIADWRDWAAAIVASPTPVAALQVHGHRRLLCARRRDPLGAAWLNAGLEQALEDAGLIHRWDDGHYPGRPLLITRNNYDLQLFNGDIGIVWGSHRAARACFPDADDRLRELPLHRLDACEPVYAMSIHKSQGSQFDHVDILTATDDDHPGIRNLLTRELIYTAITRAAYSARIWADEDLLLRSLERRTVRRTGLRRFLLDEHPAAGSEPTS